MTVFIDTSASHVSELELPEIIISSLRNDQLTHRPYYEEIIKANLRRLVNAGYIDCDTDEKKINFFKKQLPSVTWEHDDRIPFSLAIRCIYPYRLYSSKFILDIISRWLIPGKRLNIIFQFGSDFAFRKNENERYILVELCLNIETREDYKTIKTTLPMVASEIRVGVESIAQGVRILEIKGLNVDDKINLVQESIVSLMNQKADHFDRELFTEMQRFFVFSHESFKELREYRHLVRIICWQYLFRKSMRVLSDDEIPQRILRVKLMKTRLHYPYGAKNVLGVLIGVSQITENERFGEAQITRAIQNSVPSAKLVSKSYLSNKKIDDPGLIIYAEFDKGENQPFSFEELTKLRTVLSDDLRGCIEQFMHPIFMPRNEEEVMRNILNLSKQLKNYNDIPQIIISFDRQSERHITFSVILLRAIQNEDLTVQDLCIQRRFKFEFIPDRIKIVGQIKRRCVKEANVFYVRIDKQSFLRKDHTLDLYKARQALVDELYRVFEDIRDYNGGMIAKENELFTSLKQSLKNKNEIFNELILENFFYSLTPVVIRSLVDVKLLETAFMIFQALLDTAISQKEGYTLKFAYQPKHVFAYIASRSSGFQLEISKALAGLKLARLQLISSFIKVEDSFYLALIFQSERNEERKRFYEVLRKALEVWENNRKHC